MALTIVTNPVTAVTTTTAICGGNSITSPTGTITAKGVCWSTSVNPTTLNSNTNNIGSFPGNSNFTSNLAGLTPGTLYYIRAYVTENISGTSTTYYGANVVFSTLGLTTAAATSITSTTATTGASSVTNFTSVSSVGVCWGTTSNPVISNNHTSDILTGTTFTSYLTGLAPGTTYNIRAYVIYNTVPIYGDNKTFTTLTTSPVVTTTAPLIITSTTANPNGNVVSIGGASLNITKRGVCYSTSSTGIDITVSPSSFATQVSQTGTYSTGAFTGLSSITGLTPGTTYYYRAYAINSDGSKYAYGEQKTFITLGGPTVETIIPYSITSSTAQVGCNILTIGGSPLTARGVVISTLPDPTLATGTVYNDLYPGNGNQYLTKLTGLTKDTTYYIKGYATNAQGIGYGEELIFSTTSCNPQIEECDTQEYPVIECSDSACEYIIPLECVAGEIDTPSCNNLIPEDPTLLSSLIQINNVLCSLTTNDYIRFILGTIINSESLSTVFCNTKYACRTITATFNIDNGSDAITILTLSSEGVTLIGRTITSDGVIPSNTTIISTAGFTVNGYPGTYKLSKNAISDARSGTANLTF